MSTPIRDLLLKIAILGSIHAKNRHHNRLLGHVFQPSPPAIHRLGRAALPWLLVGGVILVGGAITTRSRRQALSTAPAPVS